MLVFDTNVLVDAYDPRSEFHEPCKRVVLQARYGVFRGYLTWSVCYEFLRVTTHRSAVSSPGPVRESWAFIQSLLESPYFSILVPTARHDRMLSQTLAELPQIRGTVIHDLHIAVIMRENDVNRICTRDSDFRRFPFLEVIDPLLQST